MSEVNTPSLRDASKEFNTGMNIIVDFLVGKGFSREDLRPFSKLTGAMYLSLQREFKTDKGSIRKSVEFNQASASQWKLTSSQWKPIPKPTEQSLPARSSELINFKKAFLSYSKKDVDVATKLVNNVKQMGYEVWVDSSHIRIGKGWDKEIEDAIHQCDNFLVLLTESSVASDNVRNEIDLALEENKNIVPILASACKRPLSIRRFQFIDLTTNYPEAMKQLEKILK